VRDEDAEASRRTLLAGERTLLAWVRTGLTVLAVAVGVGKIAPELGPQSHATAYSVLGSGYAVLGVAVIVYGLWRGRLVDHAIRAGRFEPLGDRAMWGLGGAMIALGVATTVLIVIDV
jgi:putative membrane protein